MSDQDLNISIQATLDGVEEALDTVKDLFTKGSEAAEAMNEMVGSNLSDSLKKVTSDTTVLAPALESAFSPLAIVSFAAAVADAAEKLSNFIADTFIYTDADKQAVTQIKEENKVLLELANRTKEANRQRQLLMASSDSERDKLKLKFQIEDLGGTPEQLKAKLDKKIEEYKTALTDSKKTQSVPMFEGEMGSQIGETEEPTQAALEAAERVKSLEKEIPQLEARVKDAAAATALSTAQLAKDQAREADETVREQEQARRQDIALNIVRLDASKKVSDAVIQQNQEEVRAVLQQQQLGAEAELALNRDLVNKKFQADEEYLQKKLAQLKRDPTHNAQQIAAVNGQIEALQVQHNTALLKLDENYYKEVEKNGEAAVEKAAANDKKILANWRASMQERMQALAEKEKSEGQLEEQAVEQQLARGNISKQQEIAQIAALKQDELQIEINYLRDREKLYQGDQKEIEKIEAQIAKYQAQQAQIGAKAVTEELKEEKAQYDKLFSGMTSALSSFTQGLLSGNQSLGQAWAKMVDGMATKFIEGLERQLMSFMEHKLMEVAIHEQADAEKDAASEASHAKEDLRTAYSAAKAAYESVVHTPIIGPILAPIEAAVAFAAVSALGSAEGGQYLVPGPQLTMLHPQEMVLPAGLATRMRDVVENGGSGGSRGVTVVVNHSVNAIDAESFQGTIRKHGNMIGNEVARVLKRKGFAPA